MTRQGLWSRVVCPAIAPAVVASALALAVNGAPHRAVERASANLEPNAQQAIQPDSPPDSPPDRPSVASPSSHPLELGSASAPRGAVGEIHFEYAGAALCATADQPETAPILVRLSRLEEPSGGAAVGPARYRLTFLGSVAGEYDLLPLIEHCDGRPVIDLAPIRVSIYSQLPERHGTDLYLVERPLPSITGRYRLIVGALIALWILVPALALLRWSLTRAKPLPPPAPLPEPTLADQLRPLVEGAMARGLSIAEQGRLELLLLRYWRSRLALDGLPPAEAIARLRRQPEAGRLLMAIEGWLHADRSRSAQPTPSVAELLEPYRGVAALSEAEISRLAGEGVDAS